MYKINLTYYLNIFGDDVDFVRMINTQDQDYSYEAHQWLLYRLFRNDVFQFHINKPKMRKYIGRVVY